MQARFNVHARRFEALFFLMYKEKKTKQRNRNNTMVIKSFALFCSCNARVQRGVHVWEKAFSDKEYSKEEQTFNYDKIQREYGQLQIYEAHKQADKRTVNQVPQPG